MKVEPDCDADPSPADCFRRAGFEPGRPVQPAATILVDLSPSPEAILAAMKPKTCYNIRLAAKKGVSVRAAEAADVTQFYRLCRITARRDGFAIHSAAYYRAAFNAFPPSSRVLRRAELNGDLLAGLMAFAWDGRAYYLYGASSDRRRNTMPAYLLQWQAMQWARSADCRSYDLWGIPDAPLDTLEADFSHRSDGLWGVYRFKRGFGGRVARSAGAFDFVYNRPLYRLFVRLAGWGAG